MEIREKKNEKRVYTSKEASEFLCVSSVTLWRERRAGRIAYRRVSSKIVYTIEDLENYLNFNKHGEFAKGKRK